MRVPSDAQARLLASVQDSDSEVGITNGGEIAHTRGAITFYQGRVRIPTAAACFREGWLEGEIGTGTVELTEDGTIALGLWRARKLRAPAPPLPSLSDRQREVVELALRALEMGYALCPREPARLEARRMRRAGWFTDCWVANNATGLVPTPLALVEVRPADADSAPPRMEAR